MISAMKLCTNTDMVAYLKSQCTMGNNKKRLLHNIIKYHRVDYAQNGRHITAGKGKGQLLIGGN